MGAPNVAWVLRSAALFWPFHMFSWLSLAMAKCCKAATAMALASRSFMSVLDAASMSAVRIAESSHMGTCKLGSPAMLARAWHAYSFARLSSGTSTVMRAPFSNAALAPSASDHIALFSWGLWAKVARPLSPISRMPRSIVPFCQASRSAGPILEPLRSRAAPVKAFCTSRSSHMTFLFCSKPAKFEMPFSPANLKPICFKFGFKAALSKLWHAPGTPGLETQSCHIVAWLTGTAAMFASAFKASKRPAASMTRSLSAGSEKARKLAGTRSTVFTEFL
mmetsp:Transcript_15756/g.45237  ORF Transcript_15756/g.45237 Transcript_15756/m.45237 type:complete len:278 (+) Transcript_15756:265-1098(+)